MHLACPVSLKSFASSVSPGVKNNYDQDTVDVDIKTQPMVLSQPLDTLNTFISFHSKRLLVQQLELGLV
jgi:hypothetical protein